jgi:hypothetical protein
VEAPHSTRGRMPAQHPAAFLCAHEFARMKILPWRKQEQGRKRKQELDLIDDRYHGFVAESLGGERA